MKSISEFFTKVMKNRFTELILVAITLGALLWGIPILLNVSISALTLVVSAFAFLVYLLIRFGDVFWQIGGVILTAALVLLLLAKDLYENFNPMNWDWPKEKQRFNRKMIWAIIHFVILGALFDAVIYALNLQFPTFTANDVTYLVWAGAGAALLAYVSSWLKITKWALFNFFLILVLLLLSSGVLLPEFNLSHKYLMFPLFFVAAIIFAIVDFTPTWKSIAEPKEE